jgi:carboxypeptidase Taq
MSFASLERLKSLDRDIRHMEFTIAVVDWDQQTYMPTRSAEERSEQSAMLEGIGHKMNTAEEIGELLAGLGADEENPGGDETLADVDRAFVRETYKRFRKLTKLPARLVTELAKARSLSQTAWVEARKNDRYSDFAPSLVKVLGLVRETAECLGYKDHVYDALLDDYEPGMKTAEVTDVFAGLSGQLSSLVARITEVRQVKDDFLTREYPVEQQETFGREILRAIGFDFERGRLDVSAHPFTTTLGPHDVRLTTRYESNWFESSLFGSIHEGGHGMYEQGFAESISGSILGDATSLGIHESQSRSWENIIGRSRPFWTRFYPRMRELFGSQLADVSLEEFYRGINRVEPSLIRVEADEVTYSLHIVLRFELEKALLAGDLSVEDLPAAWNERMFQLLGIRPDNDADGVLQDIHWSAGLIGYFPTYALGNLYGAQFAAQMEKDVNGLDACIERGDFQPILDWQRRHIHSKGRILSAGQICENSTGERLNPAYFIDYLTRKYEEIYGL